MAALLMLQCLSIVTVVVLKTLSLMLLSSHRTWLEQFRVSSHVQLLCVLFRVHNVRWFIHPLSKYL